MVEEQNQYKNLGVVKNYVCSFQLDIDEAIEKTRKKAGMILNGYTDRKETHPTVYVKFWKQVCLPSLSFGSEVWIIGQSQTMPEMVFAKSISLTKIHKWPRFNGSVLTETD